ncbi:CoA transferase [Peristeroidobacter soli]|uniref:CoA transferase n=1 Tax=Peristeroidobacter soli TaxID=2497877 RepID=UPI00101DC744|nr:CoA transferase [Peristeroidobacter soli]
MSSIAADVKVVDLAVGLSAAVIVKSLTDNGAQVTRIAPPGGDPFATVYPAYEALKGGARSLSAEVIDAQLADADVCLIGGEDHPGLSWRFDAEALQAKFPRLVIVQLSGYALDPSRPAVDLLVQARTGLVHEQLNDQPVQFAVALPSYGAALSGLIGLWAALIERERSGLGQIVRTSMQRGLALFWSQIWMEAERADALFDKLPPKDVQHLIFECADGDYIHFVLGVPNALAKLYAVLGIDIAVDPNERGIPTLARGPQSYFADRSIIEPFIKRRQRAELVAALNEAGLAAEPVLMPGEAWSLPQVQASGLLSQREDGSTLMGNPLRFEQVSTPSAGAELSPSNAAGALAGLRIVDFGNFIAGPYASKLLADLGADVIRVEPPTSLAALTGMRNTVVANRGKRSIVIDMKSAEGLELAHRLCASADVSTHNFRLGVDARLGIDPASLRRIRANIVTLATTGYGSIGPKAKDAGWDMVMQALCGHEARAGGKNNRPMWYRSAYVDFATGALGAIAILMAVYSRLRHHTATAAENSLLGTSLFLMSELLLTPDRQFVGAPLLNSQRTGFHPTEQLYRTRDGWIAIAARGETMSATLARTFELQPAPATRAEWNEHSAAQLADRLSSLSSAEAVARLESAGVWVERCNPASWQTLRDDPRARAAGLVVEAQDSAYGRVLSTFGPVVTFSRSRAPGALRSSPAHGEHSREILAELGVAAEQIESLLANGTVR